jgi:release factor glutamine methyltransferase
VPLEQVTEPASVGEAIELAARRLSAAGVPSARREAGRLITDLLHLDPPAWWPVRDRGLEAAERRRIAGAIADRARGMPLAYVTGVVGFRHLTLKADRRALIPRPESEGLIDRALRLQPTGVAVDVGTGSGCLALALQQEGHYRAVIGIDRSRVALELAAENRSLTGLPIGLIRGDLLTGCRADSVDLLVANPPYLTDREHELTDSSVRDFEPAEALASGLDGLRATEAILRAGRRVVRPGGWIIVELAADRAAMTGGLASALGWSSVQIDEDFFGRPRYLVARREDDTGP